MSNKFVVIECKGKQYKVSEGDVVSVDLINEEVSKKINIDNILLYSEGNKVNIGQPYLEMQVSAEIIAHERDAKVHVFKFKKKTGYKKKQGHKQKYTTLKILSIGSKKPSKNVTTDKDSKKKDTPKAKSDK